MKVWIDQDLCTGDGLCEEIAPDVFTLLDDGLAYVKEGDSTGFCGIAKSVRSAERGSPCDPVASTTSFASGVLPRMSTSRPLGTSR